MALTVGTDSYVSLDNADAYATAHFTGTLSATWSGADDTTKEAALREATQYLDGKFDWIGSHPGGVSQVLGWPRNNAVDHEGRHVTGIPQRVADATVELAGLAISGRLVPASDRGGEIKRAKVGPLEVEYSDQAPVTRSFRFVRQILKGLTRSRNRLTRV